MLIQFFYKFHPFLFPDGSREAHPNFKKNAIFQIFPMKIPILRRDRWKEGCT